MAGAYGYPTHFVKQITISANYSALILFFIFHAGLPENYIGLKGLKTMIKF